MREEDACSTSLEACRGASTSGSEGGVQGVQDGRTLYLEGVVCCSATAAFAIAISAAALAIATCSSSAEENRWTTFTVGGRKLITSHSIGQ